MPSGWALAGATGGLPRNVRRTTGKRSIGRRQISKSLANRGGRVSLASQPRCRCGEAATQARRPGEGADGGCREVLCSRSAFVGVGSSASQRERASFGLRCFKASASRLGRRGCVRSTQPQKPSHASCTEADGRSHSRQGGEALGEYSHAGWTQHNTLAGLRCKGAPTTRLAR